MRRPVLRPTLPALGPDELGHLELHQLRGHRWRLLSSNLERPDDHERQVAVTTPVRPTRSCTSQRDVTKRCALPPELDRQRDGDVVVRVEERID
jgi:hypothetical protein